MYDTYYNPYARSSVESSMASGALAGGLVGFIFTFLATCWILVLALAVLKFIGTWKMFTKAGLDGWESLVPGHNVFVEFQLAGIKTYWYFLLFVPIANVVVLIWKDIELAKSYGKGIGFGLGLFFLAPIFYPILGLGSAKYVGPKVSNTANNTSANTANVENVQSSEKSNNSNNSENK